MLRFPNAKINLGLYITNRRADGYHDLETVFYPIRWADALEAVPAKEFSLTVTGRAVSGDPEKNLVHRAFHLLESAFPDQVFPLEMHLHKVLPMGAGLGGGSADGAFALQLINDLCSLGLSAEALATFALHLGSDCPFFLFNKPAFAAGRGEALTPLALDLSDYSIQVICPGIHVSTAEAFRGITPARPGFDLHTLATLSVPEWQDRLENSFEKTVFAKHPEIAAIKESLCRQGALYASMSGSGSAVFGIFEKGHKADPAGYESYWQQ